MAVKRKKKVVKKESVKKTRIPQEDQEDDLIKRMETQAKQKTKQGGGGSSTCLDLSKFNREVVWFKVEEGKKMKIDIIPFKVSTKWYKNLLQNDESDTPTGRKQGALEPFLCIPVHKQVGSGNKTVLCLKEAFGKKCPICEEQDSLFAKAKEKGLDLKQYYKDNKKTLNGLRAKWRVFYNVINRNKKSDGVQLWEMSYFLFQQVLNNKLMLSDEGIVPYAHLKQGRAITFIPVKKAVDNYSFLEIPAIEFSKRKTPYKDSILNETYQLDEAVIILTYEEIKAMFYELDAEEIDVDEEDADELPTKFKPVEHTNSDDDEEEDTEEEEEDTEEEEEDTEEEEEEEEEEDEDEDEEDEDEDEEEEED